ncbi:hypothetical protein TNCV_1136261 [Trichonephila clavipes]|nr:hypothetical protein TNCV_1136261 [Trichonephila clavipes]
MSLAIPRVLKLGMVSTISSTISRSIRYLLPSGMNRSHIIAGVGEKKHGMSRSPPDRMPFGVQPLSGSTIAICGPVRQNHICFLHSSYSAIVQPVCVRCKYSCGLLLIVLSLWRLIQLSTVKFAYSAF